MKTANIISGAALSLALTSTAFAGVSGPFTGFYPGPTLTDYNTLSWPAANISIPSFDSTLGTLTSIDYTWTGRLGSTQSAHNPSLVNNVVNLVLNGTATIGIQPPGGGAPFSIVFPAVSNSQATVLPDATASFPEAFMNASDIDTVVAPATLAAFTTVGAGSLLLPVTATLATLSGTDSGSIDQLSIVGRASGRITVTYNYSETQVPEPKVYGAIGAVACLGLLGYRRYRNSRQA